MVSPWVVVVSVLLVVTQQQAVAMTYNEMIKYNEFQDYLDPIENGFQVVTATGSGDVLQASCPVSKVILFGWVQQIHGNHNQDNDCIGDVNFACPVGVQSCTKPACTEGNQRSTIVLYCAYNTIPGSIAVGGLTKTESDVSRGCGTQGLRVVMGSTVQYSTHLGDACFFGNYKTCEFNRYSCKTSACARDHFSYMGHFMLCAPNEMTSALAATGVEMATYGAGMSEQAPSALANVCPEGSVVLEGFATRYRFYTNTVPDLSHTRCLRGSRNCGVTMVGCPFLSSCGYIVRALCGRGTKFATASPTISPTLYPTTPTNSPTTPTNSPTTPTKSPATPNTPTQSPVVGGGGDGVGDGGDDGNPGGRGDDDDNTPPSDDAADLDKENRAIVGFVAGGLAGLVAFGGTVIFATRAKREDKLLTTKLDPNPNPSPTQPFPDLDAMNTKRGGIPSFSHIKNWISKGPSHPAFASFSDNIRGSGLSSLMARPRSNMNSMRSSSSDNPVFQPPSDDPMERRASLGSLASSVSGVSGMSQSTGYSSQGTFTRPPPGLSRFKSNNSQTSRPPGLWLSTRTELSQETDASRGWSNKTFSPQV